MRSTTNSVLQTAPDSSHITHNLSPRLQSKQKTPIIDYSKITPEKLIKSEARPKSRIIFNIVTKPEFKKAKVSSKRNKSPGRFC